MISTLQLENVGPAPRLEVELAPRLNLLTGDNGLGKSFMLDILWFVLSRSWPADLNPDLLSGLPAQPFRRNQRVSIEASFPEIPGKSGSWTAQYRHNFKGWTTDDDQRIRPRCLAIYGQVDGSFSVWDPLRNRILPDGDPQRPRAFVFSPKQLWHGLVDRTDSTKVWCRGLIADWAAWQTSRDQSQFEALQAVLEQLRPNSGDPLEPGELTRLDVAEAKDIPTIRMSSGEEIPLPFLSSGIRRILNLAYLLVWSWKEHIVASRIFETEPVSHIVLLIDEIEAHLHPSWQRTILPALFAALKKLTADEGKASASAQVVAVTHSPLVMLSAEPFFDPARDAWHDFDLVSGPGGGVRVARRDWIKQGDASNWLTSKAFDLPSSRSEPVERILEEAKVLLESSEGKNPADFAEEARAIHRKLLENLPETDPFLFRWRYIAQRKNWLQ